MKIRVQTLKLKIYKENLNGLRRAWESPDKCDTPVRGWGLRGPRRKRVIYV